LKPALEPWANTSSDPILKKPITKQKRKKGGGGWQSGTSGKSAAEITTCIHTYIKRKFNKKASDKQNIKFFNKE
jgi:hypothetical protein